MNGSIDKITIGTSVWMAIALIVNFGFIAILIKRMRKTKNGDT